jgi:hypothetical protein
MLLIGKQQQNEILLIVATCIKQLKKVGKINRPGVVKLYGRWAVLKFCKSFAGPKNKNQHT